MNPNRKAVSILFLVIGMAFSGTVWSKPQGSDGLTDAAFGFAESGKADEAQESPTPKKGGDKKGTAQDEDEGGSVLTPRDRYSIYSTGLFQEVFIDDNLSLYQVRQYGGIVPSLEEKRGTNLSTPIAGPGEKLLIHRIGFEQRELFSRLFVLGNGAISPWIYDNFAQAQGNPEIAYQIIVEIPGAKIPKHNDRRPLITSAFNSPVASIEGSGIKGGGVRIVVTLKREARYLPVQVGRLLFIDVER